jgi:hypothetical protein
MSGLRFAEQLDALGTVGSFANDDKFAVRVQEFTQTIAENDVVIRNQYLDFGHSRLNKSGLLDLGARYC